eukprot:scaffold22672_cov141-Cylindrotheca_fusiformis.AAC.3
MPERSKGFDSSSNIFVCVGSNPTECNLFIPVETNPRFQRLECGWNQRASPSSMSAIVTEYGSDLRQTRHATFEPKIQQDARMPGRVQGARCRSARCKNARSRARSEFQISVSWPVTGDNMYGCMCIGIAAVCGLSNDGASCRGNPNCSSSGK